MENYEQGKLDRKPTVYTYNPPKYELGKCIHGNTLLLLNYILLQLK